MTPDEIKKRIESLKQRENELLIKENAIAEFKPLFENSRAKIKEATVNNNVLVLKELLQSTQNGADFNEVITSIEKLANKTDNMKMLAAMKSMVDKLSILENKNYFDTKEFNTIFMNGLNKVINAVVDPNQIPEETNYTRNSKGKISTVTEKYSDQTIKFNWQYDSKGRLSKVISKTT